jgi:hypothetical protein
LGGLSRRRHALANIILIAQLFGALLNYHVRALATRENLSQERNSSNQDEGRFHNIICAATHRA